MHGDTVFKKYTTGVGTMTLRGSIGCMQQTTEIKVSNLKAVYFPIITFPNIAPSLAFINALRSIAKLILK